MVSRPSLVTITQAEIEALCRRLEHDPSRVARITIEPHVVVVEYEHPITGIDPAEPDVTQPVTVKDDICGLVSPGLGDGAGWVDICRRPSGHAGAHVAKPWETGSLTWTEAESESGDTPSHS